MKRTALTILLALSSALVCAAPAMLWMQLAGAQVVVAAMPAWRDNEYNAAQFYSALGDEFNSSVTFDPNIFTPIPNTAGILLFTGSLLATDGSVNGLYYASLYDIDTSTDICTTRSYSQAGIAMSGFLNPANDKLYCFTTGKVTYKYDTTNNTYEVQTDADSHYTGSMSLAGDGHAYGWFNTSSDPDIFFTYNTSTDMMTSVDTGIGLSGDSGPQYSHPAVIGVDNCLYWAPWAGRYVAKYDPQTSTPSKAGYYTSGAVGDDERWANGCCAPNGVMYWAPYKADYILKIDSNTGTESLIDKRGIDGGTFTGCILGPDGKIYFFPGTAAVLMMLDPSDDSLSSIAWATNRDDVCGVTLAANGAFYVYCYSGFDVYKIGAGNLSLNTDIVYSRYLNRMQSGR